MYTHMSLLKDCIHFTWLGMYSLDYVELHLFKSNFFFFIGVKMKALNFGCYNFCSLLPYFQLLLEDSPIVAPYTG